jgi:competence protein ComEC
MPLQTINSWQSAPFLRLLIPFVIGILSAYHFNITAGFLQKVAAYSIFILLIFSLASITIKFKWMLVSGCAIHTLLFVFGATICNQQDLRKQNNFIGYHYNKNDSIIAIIQEPLIQKRKTWKVIANVLVVKHRGKWIKVRSKLLIYIKNTQLAKQLATSDTIEFAAPLQQISNNFNAGSFDFVRYCAFQQIYFQLYIPDSTILFFRKNSSAPKKYLYKTRDYILNILKKAIPEKTAQSVAEALLIGYKEDLDKSLVQSYSNTGVVHIIAISGLHLTMIYSLLLRLLQPFGNKRWNIYLRSVIILMVLWGFSFITGGAAAILRSAVGFTLLLISKSLGYKNNTINAIAASAFFLLAYDPFLLWDIGFQLSYTAVLGIVLFSRNIENWFFFKNKLLQLIWQVNAVTLSAQVLTLPIILYQFHQFPNLFLFTNFLVVPLSGLILYAELLVLLVSPIPILLKWSGLIASFLINQMNGIIERTNRIPFALTKNIAINLPETILLYILIASVLVWLLYKNSRGFVASVAVLFLWTFLRFLSFF